MTVVQAERAREGIVEEAIHGIAQGHHFSSWLPTN